MIKVINVESCPYITLSFHTIEFWATLQSTLVYLKSFVLYDCLIGPGIRKGLLL